MSYIVLRPKGDNWYKYEIESYREGGQVKKRQKYLGRASEEEIAAWCAKRGIHRPAAGGKPLKKQPQSSGNDLRATTSPQEKEAAKSPATAKERPPELLWYLANFERQDHRSFLAEWLPKFREKFGRKARVVYVNEADVGAISGDGLEVEIKGCRWVPRWFYQIG